MSYNSKTQGEHVTRNCKGKLSDNKVPRGCKTEMTDVGPNSSHQILTCINAEPAKVSCCTVQRIKVLKRVQTISKYLGIKLTSLGPTSNVCNLRRSGSADLLVKQLQRLCMFMWWRQVALYFLVRKSATGIRKKKQQHQQFWEKLCSNTWLVVEASLFNWSTIRCHGSNDCLPVKQTAKSNMNTTSLAKGSNHWSILLAPQTTQAQQYRLPMTFQWFPGQHHQSYQSTFSARNGIAISPIAHRSLCSQCSRLANCPGSVSCLSHSLVASGHWHG